LGLNYFQVKTNEQFMPLRKNNGTRTDDQGADFLLNSTLSIHRLQVDQSLMTPMQSSGISVSRVSENRVSVVSVLLVSALRSTDCQQLVGVFFAVRGCFRQSWTHASGVSQT